MAVAAIQLVEGLLWTGCLYATADKDGEKEKNHAVPKLQFPISTAVEGQFQICISPDPDPLGSQKQ